MSVDPYTDEQIYGRRRPRRIQMSRQRPWRAENPDAVIVDRTSKWGNPFKVGERVHGDVLPGRRRVPSVKLTAAAAVELFRAYTLSEPETVNQIRAELAGRDLACWCRPNSACHADVLLEIANTTSISAFLESA